MTKPIKELLKDQDMQETSKAQQVEGYSSDGDIKN